MFKTKSLPKTGAWILGFALAAHFTITPQQVYANCISLIKGPMIIDIASCGVLNPEQSFDVTKELYKFIPGLPAKQQKEFYESYRGLLVKGKVIKSTAIRSGLVPEKKVLEGENINFFIPPLKGNCVDILGKRIKTDINEACCEGGGEAPCLLSSALVTKSFEVLGNASSSAGDKRREHLKNNKNYQNAEKLFASGKFEKAIGYYLIVKNEDKLDIKGHYQLGLAYRNIDKCNKAIPILNWIREQSANQKIWSDEETTARKGILLLARCYSKISDANMAIVILDSYLSDPKKYQREIREAMTHADFGWIKTTKEYQRFLEEAGKKLR